MTNSRRKGKELELEAAHQLRPLYPEARRSYGQSRAGDDAPDLEGTPYWVEVSGGKRPDIRGKIRQATEATDGRPVLVMTRVDRGEWLVTMRYEDWKARVEPGCQQPSCST